MNASTLTGRRCPECGAEIRASSDRCWLCRAELQAQQPVAESSPAGSPTERPPLQFGLATLLLVIVLVAVILGVGRLWLPAGVVLLVLVVPALVRSVSSSRLQLRQGTTLSVGEKLTGFVSSLCIVLVACVAGGIAFYGTCWVGFLGVSTAGQAVSGGQGGYEWLMNGLVAGCILGAVVGIYLMYRILKKTWPRAGKG